MSENSSAGADSGARSGQVSAEAPVPAPRGLRAAAIGYGNFLFKHRNWVFPVLLIALFDLLRPAPLGGAVASDLWLNILGAAVSALGLAIRGAVIGLAYIKRGGLNKRIYAENLVTEGVFAHCRNPLYVGNVLMLFGYLAMHNNPWVWLIGGGFTLISYTSIVAAEEHFLRGTFGSAYEAYCRDVPRWWIRLNGLGATLNSMSFNWTRVVIKDYATAMFAVMIVSGLFAYDVWAVEGFPAAWPAVYWVAAVWATVVVLATIVRILKKNGRWTDK